MFTFFRSLVGHYSGDNDAQQRKPRPQIRSSRRSRTRLALEPLETRYAPATFTVINTLDSGAGSLRQAIVDANNTVNVDSTGDGIADPDLINFNIPGAGVHTIAPTSNLPPITAAVTIDGYSQPKNDGSGNTATENTLAVGDNAVLLIEIDGTSAPNSLFVLSGAGGSTVKGLVVNRAINVTAFRIDSDSNTIAGNFLGTDATGATFLPTGFETIFVQSGTGNKIGGTAPKDRNVIVSAGGTKQFIDLGNGAGGSIVQGNYIGINAAGTARLGTAADDTMAIITGVAGGNLIGGTTPGAGNVIVGTRQGILLQGPNNTVQGNLIGTNATGTAGLGGGTGIQLQGGGANNSTIADNLISGNTTGVGVNTVSPAKNVIRANKIGTDITGTAAIANSGNGIQVSSPTAGGTLVTIGGTDAGDGNIIAFNGGNGVLVNGGPETAAILGNSIFSNFGLGIDLQSTGDAFQVTDNDTGDGDNGPNSLQNFPELTTATATATDTTISGTLNSTANGTFRIEFFASAAADPSCFGEGKTFLGFKNVTTNGSGNVNFTATTASDGLAALPLGQRIITATATNTSTNDTSEFSEFIVADGFVVTNINNSGPGSLDQAIRDANGHANVDQNGDANPDPDLIIFCIDGAGVHTITPSTSLPFITDPVIIDGYTQHGAGANTNGPSQGDNAVLQIEISGATVLTNGLGIVLLDQADGSTIRGLVIDQGFSRGIVVQASDVHIEGCFIGVDPTGTTAHGNGVGIFFDFGVDTSNGVVGGTTPDKRNVISGNSNPDIFIQSGTRHLIQGNLIGTDATGLVRLSGGNGISIQGSNDNVIGGSTLAERNVINNNSFGIFAGNSTGNKIQGNFIQVLIDGVTPGTSTGNGIFLDLTESGTQVGGLTSIPGTGPGNVIGGNVGIQIGGLNSLIQGNLIGTDATGTKALGIGTDGIQITGGPNTIGGPSPNARNVISGFVRAGIFIFSGGAPVQGALIQNNFIGTDINGNLNSMGNGEGVFVSVSTGIQFLGNIIAGNAARGVDVNNGATQTSILGNSIFANGALGIDLVGGTQDAFGVTANDPGDGDTGPNNLQNFPVITSVNSAGGTTTIAGTLNSTPSTPITPITFRIEFFASDAVDPSGFGEGQFFLGFTDVTTDVNGDVSFTATLPVTVGPTQSVTATATRLNDGTLTETSEFSEALAVEVVEPVASLQFSDPAFVVGEEGGQILITVTRSGGVRHAVTVDFAASQGTASAGQDFTAVSGTLDFGVDETSKTFAVPILEDAAVEGDETVNLTLSNAQNNAELGTPNTAVLTIRDNDVPPPPPPPARPPAPPPAPTPTTESIIFTFVSREAIFHSELGLFQIDDSSGRIGNLHPGDPGYAAAALARRQVIFTRAQRPGAVRTLTIPAGSRIAFYLVQNASSSDFLAGKSRRAGHHKPQVFFSITAANADRVNHVRFLSPNRFGFEDLTGGGDRDFNDLVVRITRGSSINRKAH